jgi:hypothetical protein
MAKKTAIKQQIVCTGTAHSVLMTDAVAEAVERLDAKRRAQFKHRIKLLCDIGPSALDGSKFNPNEGRHKIDGVEFKMGAVKTHQVRLYGAFFHSEGRSYFLIGGIDTQKKNDKQKLGVLKRAARLVGEAAKEWDLA